MSGRLKQRIRLVLTFQLSCLTYLGIQDRELSELPKRLLARL